MSSIENPYYGQIRTDLLKLLPQDIKIEKSLDVGCGLGKTSAYLKSKYKIKETVGIEYVPEIAQAAKANIDRVYSLSVDQDELPFSKDEFDLILLADILEHLIDPWAVAKRFVSFLKPGGYAIFSLPNIQNWKIILKLLTNKWEYQDHGILDRTHLRFFTVKTSRKLVQQTGLNSLKITRTMGNELKVINWLSLGLLKNILTYHIYILAKKDVFENQT